MKKATITFLLFFLLLNSNVIGQTYNVAYIRITENIYGSNGIDSFLQLTYSDGRKERIELEKLGSNGKASANNGAIISNKIKELLELGYSLESQSIGGTEITHSTMIFIKKEE